MSEEKTPYDAQIEMCKDLAWHLLEVERMEPGHPKRDEPPVFSPHDRAFVQQLVEHAKRHPISVRFLEDRQQWRVTASTRGYGWFSAEHPILRFAVVEALHKAVMVEVREVPAT